MDIPIVIFQTGKSPDYFINCVNISSKKNIVYIIGDDSTKSSFSENLNVHFFHINDLESSEIDDFRKCFVNYNNNDANYELNCFLRVFYIKNLFEKTGKEWMFHTDSDCVILESINSIFTHIPKSNAYSIQVGMSEYHMGSSIHNSLINIDFCNTFVDLCFDIYKTKTKFGLIDKKIKWHQMTGMPGGICDMTLYFLIHDQKMIHPLVNLNHGNTINDEPFVFDHNFSSSYGYNGESTYLMDGSYKKLIKNGDKWYFNTVDGKEIRTVSIHFQGESAKQILSRFVL